MPNENTEKIFCRAQSAFDDAISVYLDLLSTSGANEAQIANFIEGDKYRVLDQLTNAARNLRISFEQNSKKTSNPVHWDGNSFVPDKLPGTGLPR